MRSLLEVMKSAEHLDFVECRDGALWYILTCSDKTECSPIPAILFRIPLEDVAGGTFPASTDECGYYMRWIRKELLLQKEEQEMIAKAKEEWKP